MIQGPNKRIYIIALIVSALIISFTMLPKHYQNGLYKKIHSSSDSSSDNTSDSEPKDYSTDDKEIISDVNAEAQHLDNHLEIEIDAVPNVDADSIQNKKNTPKINNIIPDGSDLL